MTSSIVLIDDILCIIRAWMLVLRSYSMARLFYCRIKVQKIIRHSKNMFNRFFCLHKNNLERFFNWKHILINATLFSNETSTELYKNSLFSLRGTLFLLQHKFGSVWTQRDDRCSLLEFFFSVLLKGKQKCMRIVMKNCSIIEASESTCQSRERKENSLLSFIESLQAERKRK